MSEVTKNNTIAIIGRPNVGKSTLFNRLITFGNRSIVSNIAGVTRDYNHGHCISDGLYWQLMDTAGLENSQKDLIHTEAMQKTIQAINRASAILFMVDGSEGILPQDEYWCKWIKTKFANKNIVVAINKCDHKITEENITSVYRLGFKEHVCVSAEHNIGIIELLDKIKIHAITEDNFDVNRSKNSIRVAIIGRPNAGKSTLINNILKEERMMTGATPGLTRDSIEIEYNHKNNKIIFLDTAGLRKKRNIHLLLDKKSADSAIHTINYAHVVVLLLDATQGIEKQDMSLVGMAAKEGRSVIIVINKWDLVEKKEQYFKQMHDFCSRRMGDIKNIPIVSISALYGSSKKLLDEIIDVYESWNCRISTSKLNKWMYSAITAHAPKLNNGRAVNIKYISQVGTRPPTFYISTNMPKFIDDNYTKYLKNSLQKNFEFVGTPLRIKFR